MVKMTDRMKAWVETGCHLNVASKSGIPNVTVCRNVKVTDDDEITFNLSEGELSVIKKAFDENPWVAIGISKAGGIRAPYQFKGKGKLNKNELKIKILELYCTKPGAEAGLRLDVMKPETMEKWDCDHWKDMPKK